jgi:NADPH:quinone reductase-like Zn-dependent oxidoreductase
MKAVVYEKYGSPDLLELREIDRPVVADDGVLVRVHAASVNPVDWHNLTGTPYLVRMEGGLLKPKREVLGVDFAGTVEAVGKDLKEFQTGDEVFGARNGAFAEYVCARKAVVAKPANVTFEQAAALPVAITALQGLRDKGQIQAGEKILINGASGCVGTFAVQIAKSFGAEVTGVCSTRNVDTVRSLGADHVIAITHRRTSPAVGSATT